MFDIDAIIAVISAAAGGFVGAAAKVKAAREAAGEFQTISKKLRRYKESRESIAAAKRLLGLSPIGTIIYRHDNTHPLYTGGLGLHPDNRQALLALAGHDYVDALDNGSLAIESSVRGELSDNMALIGSPVAEGVSRLMFGYEPRGEEVDELISNPAIDLPYRMIFDRTEVSPKALAKRFVQGRGVVERPNWRIESDDSMFIPDLGKEGWLQADYLLLTRTRNFLTSDGLDQNHFLVSFAGTHGTGTRAAPLLLRDKTSLHRIAEATKGLDSSSFQALFRVFDIDHNPRLGSRARQIELVEPPKTLDDDPIRWRSAHRATDGRVKEWLVERSTRRPRGC